MIIQFLATFCAGLFAGAAAYVSLVEHPARMKCGVDLAIREFAPSYRRGAIMQTSLAAGGFLAALVAWLTSGDSWWLVGGLILVAAIPYTLIVILPTNKKLLDPSLAQHSELASALLIRWGRLHAVRTALGLAAFLVFAHLV